MTRGIKDEVDMFINDLSAQYFPYEANGKKIFVQLAMRPMQLWEVVFPKPCFPEVLKTVTLPTTKFDPKQYNWKQLYALRKLLNAKKIPAMDLSETGFRIVRRGCVATYPIGTKDDGTWGKGEELEGGEML